jgi:hypothetical protein
VLVLRRMPPTGHSCPTVGTGVSTAPTPPPSWVTSNSTITTSTTRTPSPTSALTAPTSQNRSRHSRPTLVWGTWCFYCHKLQFVSIISLENKCSKINKYFLHIFYLRLCLSTVNSCNYIYNSKIPLIFFPFNYFASDNIINNQQHWFHLHTRSPCIVERITTPPPSLLILSCI